MIQRTEFLALMVVEIQRKHENAEPELRFVNRNHIMQIWQDGADIIIELTDYNKLKIQNENKQWSVFITAPLYTCQSAIHENYPSLKIDTLNAFETQKLILNLVKTSFIINGDNTVKLINDKIQLAHETTLYFDIQSNNNDFSPSTINFSAFSKLINHFTLLKIVPNKGKEISFILNSDNEFNYPKIFKEEATPKKESIGSLESGDGVCEEESGCQRGCKDRGCHAKCK